MSEIPDKCQVGLEIKNVCYMELFWRSDKAPYATKDKKPHGPTVAGELVDESELSPCGKRMIDIAIERNIIDEWTPVCIVHLLYGKELRFSGNRGMEIWRKWCDMQFKDSKK